MSKIYMNCYMKFGSLGLRERQIELQSKQVILQIVRKYILKMEQSNQAVIAHNFSQINQITSQQQLIDSSEMLKNATQDEDNYDEVSEDFSDPDEEDADREVSPLKANASNKALDIHVNNIGLINPVDQ